MSKTGKLVLFDYIQHCKLYSYCLLCQSDYPGKTEFVKNLGPALLLGGSILTIEGDLRFINNTGSGISLNDISSIVLQSGSRLFFLGNKAASKVPEIFESKSSPITLTFHNGGF